MIISNDLALQVLVGKNLLDAPAPVRDSEQDIWYGVLSLADMEYAGYSEATRNRLLELNDNQPHMTVQIRNGEVEIHSAASEDEAHAMLDALIIAQPAAG